MKVNVQALLEIIGELEVLKRVQATEIERLTEQLAKATEPTPIKTEAANDNN